MEQFRFALVAFAPFVIGFVFGGPYTTSDWATKLMSSGKGSKMMVYLVQFLWFAERLLAGLGIWFFFLTDWINTTWFLLIVIFYLVYILMDYSLWPMMYFYPTDLTRYSLVALTFALGVLSLITSWIIMVVTRTFTSTVLYFWLGFGLLVGATILNIILGGVLTYVHMTGKESRGIFRPRG